MLFRSGEVAHAFALASRGLLERTGRQAGGGAIEDARRIIGRKSGEIEQLLGYAGRAELIHRDDMALTRG